MQGEDIQVHRFRLDTIAPEPWRNGLGLTRTIWAEGAAPDWRVSVAEVRQDGPFSSFPGMDRTAVLLSGCGVDLDGAGTTIRLVEASRCARFSGELALDARLHAGPVRLLNVMTRRDRWNASVELGQGAVAIDAAPAVLLVLEGGLTASLDEGSPKVSMHEDEGLVRRGGGPAPRLQAPHGLARWLLVRLRPV